MKNCLKAIRAKKEITQEELANHLGVTTSAICRFEQGTKEISSALLLAIADYLDVSLDELACREEK